MTFWAPQAPKIGILPLILRGRMKKIDKFCNPSWGGEYQPLKYATKMGGRTTHSPPPTMGGHYRWFSTAILGGENPLFWGGDLPPKMGGRMKSEPKLLHLAPYSPPHDFSFGLFSPPATKFWGGERTYG